MPTRGASWAGTDLGWVFLGGLAGTGLRYAIDAAFPVTGTTWPWPTFVVNIVGAFLLGAVTAAALRAADPGRRQRVKLIAGTGFCGAFTTYSAVALQLTTLADGGALPVALGYAIGSLVLGLGAAWLGLRVGSSGGDVQRGGDFQAGARR